jgi:hypothetical protein
MGAQENQQIRNTTNKYAIRGNKRDWPYPDEKE